MRQPLHFTFCFFVSQHGMTDLQEDDDEEEEEQAPVRQVKAAKKTTVKAAGTQAVS